MPQEIWKWAFKKLSQDGPGGPVVKTPPANAGDTGSVPGLGRFHMPRDNWAGVPQLQGLGSATGEKYHKEQSRVPLLETRLIRLV